MFKLYFSLAVIIVCIEMMHETKTKIISEFLTSVYLENSEKTDIYRAAYDIMNINCLLHASDMHQIKQINKPMDSTKPFKLHPSEEFFEIDTLFSSYILHYTNLY